MITDATAVLLLIYLATSYPPCPRKEEERVLSISQKAFQDLSSNFTQTLHPQLREWIAKIKDYAISDNEQREEVYHYVKSLILEGIVSSDLLINHPTEGKNVWMATSMINPSVSTAMGVWLLLFEGSIRLLGTDKHARYLSQKGSADYCGCFLMTEIGHGSDVKSLQTRATYDPRTNEFVIDTPKKTERERILASKFWIGNAAAYGTQGICFARLIIGEKDYGVHAFIVPIRGPDAKGCVDILDCGPKMGMNGVANGCVCFNELRIPCDNMLDKLSGVVNGAYVKHTSGSVSSKVLSGLIYGRFYICCSAAVSVSFAVAAAHRYLNVPKRVLLPMLAIAYANRLVLKDAIKNIGDHGLISGYKATFSELANYALEVLINWSGGDIRLRQVLQLASNDLVITKTFEGDNIVLLQFSFGEYLKELYEDIKSLAGWWKRSAFLTQLAQDQVIQNTDPIFQLEKELLIGSLCLIYNLSKAQLLTNLSKSSWFNLVYTLNNVATPPQEWNERLVRTCGLSQLNIYIHILKLFDASDPIQQHLRTIFCESLVKEPGYHIPAPDCLPSSREMDKACAALEPVLPELIRMLDVPDEVMASSIYAEPGLDVQVQMRVNRVAESRL